VTLQGRVQHGVVVFQNGPKSPLPDGTLVEITPVACPSASASSVEAGNTAPHVSQDVTGPQSTSVTGSRGASTADPFEDNLPVSNERQDALRQLIGICKTEQPPSDEEVQRILEQERMTKYG
jgi:hypothetical protein